jgi:glutathione S-transferase
MKFYSAWYCPFAQRSWITLLHKQQKFEYIEVDPYRLSDWWLKISRNTALVPVIVNPNSDSPGETTIIESNRTIEFLEDLSPEVNPVFPAQANQRAEHKYWMDHINNKIVPYLYRFLKAKDPGEYRDESRVKLISGIQQLTNAMHKVGPYFSGSSMGAVDISFIPFAYRIDALLGHYRDFELPENLQNGQRYQSWYQAVLKDTSFRATSTDQENYRQRLIDHYLPYSLGEGQKDVTEV